MKNTTRDDRSYIFTNFSSSHLHSVVGAIIRKYITYATNKIRKQGSNVKTALEQRNISARQRQTQGTKLSKSKYCNPNQ